LINRLIQEEIMADSTLDPEYLIGGHDRSTGRGHGTDALGPSDLSDTGSDMQGAGLPGDGKLESDTDSGGTGERAAAGRESVEADDDEIGTDQTQDVEAIDPEDTDVDAGR
jgi:hypothetical protein